MSFKIQIEKNVELPERKWERTEAEEALENFDYQSMYVGEAITFNVDGNVSLGFVRRIVKAWNASASVRNPYHFVVRELDSNGEIIPTTNRDDKPEAKFYRIYRMK